jgi:hypothetical protein
MNARSLTKACWRRANQLGTFDPERRAEGIIADPGKRHPERSAEDHPDDTAVGSTEGLTNTDLVSPAGDCVGEQAIETHRRQTYTPNVNR